jgi:hypothetical protein
MNKNTTLSIVSMLFILILSNLASAYIIRNITQEKQAEWDRYEQYKTDYVKFNDLGGYESYLSERNLQKEFGFKPASYYYVPPSVLNAYYNPPLQGDAYYTENRGYTSSLYQPSAVKYYGVNTNGRTTGYIPSTLGGKYFDHPQMNGGSYGYLTVQPQYNSQGYYGNGYYGGAYSGNSYGNSNSYVNYGNSYFGNNYDYLYGNDYNYGHESNDYNGYSNDYYDYYGHADFTNADGEEPAFYARIAEPLSGGFYVVGFY